MGPTGTLAGWGALQLEGVYLARAGELLVGLWSPVRLKVAKTAHGTAGFTKEVGIPVTREKRANGANLDRLVYERTNKTQLDLNGISGLYAHFNLVL